MLLAIIYNSIFKIILIGCNIYIWWSLPNLPAHFLLSKSAHFDPHCITF